MGFGYHFVGTSDSEGNRWPSLPSGGEGASWHQPGMEQPRVSQVPPSAPLVPQACAHLCCLLGTKPSKTVMPKTSKRIRQWSPHRAGHIDLS
jgi:hypothetical protein